ncbi:MAG: glycosyltransferase [Candidatus Nanopelagicaceae bacterium]
MDQFSQLLVALFTLITIFNFFTARSIRPLGTPISESVALLIPMRNEERNARQVIDSALEQIQLDNFRVRVLNDGSSDGTAEILTEVGDLRFEEVVAKELPKGWLGKNHALQLLADASDEEFLVFLDADVRLEKSAVADSITFMKSEGWDFISPYPRQFAKPLIAKIVQPLLQWSWFASLPLRLIERSRSTSTVVANGQFFIVKNELYREAGGHHAIRSEVLDDLELARLLRRFGGIGSVVDGSKISSCEMYPDTRSLIDGYSKSQWRAFGGGFGAMIVIAILFFSSIYPLVRSLQGQEWAIYGYLTLLTSRLLVAVRTKSIWGTALLHPIAVSLWIGLILRSLILKRAGKLSWRGRAI